MAKCIKLYPPYKKGIVKLRWGKHLNEGENQPEAEGW